MNLKYIARLFATSVVLGVLVLVPAGQASALPSLPVLPVLPVGTSHEQVLEELNSLRGKQTPVEQAAISRLVAPDVLIEELVEEDGRVSAMIAVQQQVSKERLHWESPGCSQTGACVTFNGGRKLGYNGTGVMSGSWPKVTRLVAGNKSTGLWVGRVNFTVQPGHAKNYKGHWNADTISRA